MTNPYEKEIAHDGGWTADCRVTYDTAQATGIQVDWETRELTASSPQISIAAGCELVNGN